MIWTKGETLPEDYYMLWCIEAAPDKSPFEFFRQKYGYKPTEAIVGKTLKTNLNIPNNIEVIRTNGAVTPGHIGLR